MAKKAAVSDVQSAPKREATVKTVKPRNTSVPPKAAAKSSAVSPAAQQAAQAIEITHAMIAERAYHLWLSGAPGCEHDHWCAAENELRNRR
jgi:hypothetical protein